jgi:hypothetical protein
MMEYLLLSLFILIVIMTLIFFLTWWQSSTWNLEKQNLKTQRIETLLKAFIASPLFVRENSVFDDSRLMAIKSLEGQGICEDLGAFFGSGWFLEIESLTPRAGCSGPCESSVTDYPCCSSWVICGQGSKINTTRVLPVNVYRRVDGRNDLGVLKVGVYNE